MTLQRESLHVMDDKQRIALVETETIKGGNAVAVPLPLQRHQLGNHLGSASLELAADGALISYEEYHPYGTTSFQAGPSAAEISLKRYRYTGKERDEETGLCYHGARYYAPWIGRWASCDSKAQSNLYLYAKSSPLRFVDLDGRDELELGLEVVKRALPYAGATATNGLWLYWTATGAASGPGAAAAPGAVASTTAFGAAAGGTVLLIGLVAWAVFVKKLIDATDQKYAKLANDLKTGARPRIQDETRYAPGDPSSSGPKWAPPQNPSKDVIGDPGEATGEVKRAPGKSIGLEGGIDPPSDTGRVFEFAPRVVHGGAKGKVPSRGGQVDHSPPWKSIKDAGFDLTYDEAPGIRLTRTDHQRTPDWGTFHESVMNRKLLELLIRDNQFDVAQDLKIGFIRENFGDKYDLGIKQLLQYSVEQGLRKDFGEWSQLFDDGLQKLSSTVNQIQPKVLK